MTSKYLKLLSYLENLIYTMQTRRPQELAIKLGLSISTTFEYINALKECGAPISYDRKRKCYYFNENKRFSLSYKKN
jgi:predicted DNA-binding transcriptional regulator YafY